LQYHVRDRRTVAEASLGAGIVAVTLQAGS
jgi:hypothetical protein